MDQRVGILNQKNTILTVAANEGEKNSVVLESARLQWSNLKKSIKALWHMHN